MQFAETNKINVYIFLCSKNTVHTTQPAPEKPIILELHTILLLCSQLPRCFIFSKLILKYSHEILMPRFSISGYGRVFLGHEIYFCTFHGNFMDHETYWCIFDFHLPLPHEIHALAQDRKAWKYMEVDCWHLWDPS